MKENTEKVWRKSWETPEKFLNEPWESPKKVLRKIWERLRKKPEKIDEKVLKSLMKVLTKSLSLRKPWESVKNVLRMSWECPKKILKKSWKNPEIGQKITKCPWKILRNSWEICEKVWRNSRELFLKVLRIFTINGSTWGNLEFGNYDWEGLTDTSKDVTKTTWTCLSELSTSWLNPCRNRIMGRANNGRCNKVGWH